MKCPQRWKGHTGNIGSDFLPEIHKHVADTILYVMNHKKK